MSCSLAAGVGSKAGLGSPYNAAAPAAARSFEDRAGAAVEASPRLSSSLRRSGNPPRSGCQHCRGARAPQDGSPAPPRGSSARLRGGVRRSTTPAPLEHLSAVPAVLGTPQVWPASSRRSTSRRIGRIDEAKLAGANVPSRTRCHQWHIWRVCARNASPISQEPPPRPIMASMSRRRCAQHTCRRQGGYPV